MANYTFVDELPPNGNSTKDRYTEFAKSVIRHAPAWGVLPGKYTKSTAAAYTAGINHPNTTKTGPLPLRDGTFEAASRGGKVYVRVRQDVPAKKGVGGARNHLKGTGSVRNSRAKRRAV